MGKISLVSGGCRSGKSRFALSLAEAYRKPAYLATAQTFDDEMQDRVLRHQEERDDRFTTIEEPYEVLSQFQKFLEHDLILWDCLTLWISNGLCNNKSDETILQDSRLIISHLIEAPFDTIIVSNEVGMGIVPESKLARRFRDIAGFIHQDISSLAHEVYLVSMGISLPLKKLQNIGI